MVFCLFFSISSNETGNSGMSFRNYVCWIWENDVNSHNTFHLRNGWAKKSTVTNTGEKVAAAIKLDPSQYKPLGCLRSCSFLVKAINESLVWLQIVVWWITIGYILLLKNKYQWKLDYIKVISNTSLKRAPFIPHVYLGIGNKRWRALLQWSIASWSRIFLCWLKTKENNSYFALCLWHTFQLHKHFEGYIDDMDTN